MSGSKFITKQEAARLILSANTTNDAFVAKGPTATAPVPNAKNEVGNGIFKFAQDANVLECAFFGLGSAGTFDVRIYGWRICADSELWIPYLLADLSVTLSNTTQCEAAAVGSVPTANDYVADIIAVNHSAAAASEISPGDTDNLMASFRLDTYGMSIIEFEFDKISATSVNGWVSTL